MNIIDVTKYSDYNTIADRIRAVNWKNWSHSTGVVDRFTGSITFEKGVEGFVSMGQPAIITNTYG